MVNWVILGSGGMLGNELIAALPKSTTHGFNKSQCDITNEKEVFAAIKDAQIVVNCAAWTAVDAAEENEDAAYEINALGVKKIATACLDVGAKLVQISTDYVFSGDQSTPIKTNETPAPKSAYGRTKLAGEKFVSDILPTKHFIVRTGWLFGKHGGNFVKTMLQLEKKMEFINVVNDQFGQPTWARDLSKFILDVVEKAPAGIYHGTSTGQTNWSNFAKEIFRLNNLNPDRIREVTSSDFIRPAPRPKYSVLDHSDLEAFRIQPIRPWKEALHDAFSQGSFSNI